jgi:hypothetical protein
MGLVTASRGAATDRDEGATSRARHGTMEVMKRGGELQLVDDLAELRRARSSERQVALATRILAEVREVELAVSRTRDAAMAALCGNGSSYGDVARLAGLTRGRVAQVVARTRGPRHV